MFNTPLECGLRLLFVLDAAEGRACDLQRLIAYDYLLVHSGDVEEGPHSLHPAVPFRGGEMLVKRDVLRAGLDQMFSRELLEKHLNSAGISYCRGELTKAFLDLLSNDYAQALRCRAHWVIERFGALEDADLASFMESNIGQWGAEFDRLSALNELEL
ncbi:ABC-three component system middle component 2 [Caulobacter hibisci]|uniref:ABC-three component system middle component 2 n=1 Tax=Caulobacter hibisci TaxID=2035993 RepID=UPI0018E37C7D|nr:ABC-three component system middle component 2 [Caulobacter hibisci]